MPSVDSDPMAPGLGAEPPVNRNPHPDFKQVESSRPDFNSSLNWHETKTKKPDWKPGDGPNDPSCLEKNHREIDPYAEGRPAIHNYKLLISGIVPRPIAFVSTISEDGKSTNLAPFSYFNVISHDPPLFMLCFSGEVNKPKDTLKNLLTTKECTINIISEHYIEAANYAALDSPDGISEWPFTGLHPANSKIVKPDRVKEAVFSIEAKLVETREWQSRAHPGEKVRHMAIVEGMWFSVREDAIDEEGVLIDPAVLRPMSRLGGIRYARVTEWFELPRPKYDEVMKDPDIAKLAKEKTEVQLE